MVERKEGRAAGRAAANGAASKKAKGSRASAQEPTPAFDGIPAEGICFLRGLESNNEREWFHANHGTYKASLREPLLALAAVVDMRLERFAPEYVTPPRKAVTAINRDPRFAKKDAKPYKPWLGLAFRRPGGGLGASAALYVSVSPRQVRIRCGLSVPAPHATRALRAHIAHAYAELRTILRRRGLQNAFDAVLGDRYRRLPKDVPADHPATSLLLYRSLYAEAVLPAAVARSRELVTEVTRRFRAATPLVRFIDTALLGVVPPTTPTRG